MRVTVKRHPGKIVVTFLYDHNDERERGRAARIELEILKVVGSLTYDPILPEGTPGAGTQGFTVTVDGSSLRIFTTIERALAGFTLKLWPVEGSDDEWIAETRNPIPDYGYVMTLRSFLRNVKDGGFIDYDGTGNYAMKDWMSDEAVCCAAMREGKVNRRYTHVVWFNK